MENILVLNLDSTNEYVFFVNESKSTKELNSFNSIINYLNSKYLNSKIVDKMPSLTKTNLKVTSNKFSNFVEDPSYESEMMIKYNIHYINEKYEFLEYKYGLLKDAINYAQLLEKKEKKN